MSDSYRRSPPSGGSASDWRPPGVGTPEPWRPPATVGGQPVPLWMRELVRLMDSAFKVPGTEIRVGLDPVLGLLLPGAGDVLGAVPSMMILMLAVRQGVPPVIVLRMLLNIGIDSLIGAVPLLGDLFDVAYRSNTKNLALLEAHTGAPRKPGVLDYLIVGFAIATAIALALLPLLLVALIVKALFS
jgi:hypothetical protein